jgi:hypothetical protein
VIGLRFRQPSALDIAASPPRPPEPEWLFFARRAQTSCRRAAAI